MDKLESDFIALKELHERIKQDPQNAGWYMHKAYRLGKGDSIEDVFEFPPLDIPVLRIVK